MITRRPRVPLVEDDSAIRSSRLGRLETAAFEAVGTAGAAEALEILARHRVDMVGLHGAAKAEAAEA